MVRELRDQTITGPQGTKAQEGCTMPASMLPEKHPLDGASAKSPAVGMGAIIVSVKLRTPSARRTPRR